MGRKNRRRVEYRKTLPKINTLVKHSDIKDLHRMDIWYAHLPMYRGTCIQGGVRPVLIVSNDKNNELAETITVLPMTSKMKHFFMPTHVPLVGIGMDSQVLAEQITTIDKKFLTHKAGNCTNTDLIRAVENAMRIQLGIEVSA